MGRPSAPLGVSATQEDIEGTRPLNEDIHQLISKGVQFPQAMADDILARNSVPQAQVKRNRWTMKHG